MPRKERCKTPCRIGTEAAAFRKPIIPPVGTFFSARLPSAKVWAASKSRVFVAGTGCVATDRLLRPSHDEPIDFTIPGDCIEHITEFHLAGL